MASNRTSYQEGFIERVHRAKGPDRWVYRWWASPQPDGARTHRSRVIGMVTRFPTLAKAKQAVENFRSEINAAEEKTLALMTVAEAWAHFQANELRDPNVDRSPTTIQSYLDYFKAHIIPKWGDVPLDEVKSVAVERWLRSLTKAPAPPRKVAIGEAKPTTPKDTAPKPLAPASKAKIRNHMSALFSHCIRHELYTKLNPIAPVRQSAVRQQDPDILTLDEMRSIINNIKPAAIKRWLKALHTENGLAWTTVSKIRGIMHRIYKIGVLHERVEKNPVEHVETRSLSLYKALVITPQQTLAILNRLSNPLHFTLVLTCAATALRASEIVSLRWSDILWSDRQIRISKRWAKGADGDTKTAASNGYVPLHPVLAEYLKHWRTQTPHSKVDDFVFPSLLRFGRVPISASIFVADYLRPAATGAGVILAKGQRFGFHNLRHSLSTWLVNKGKVDPKTVQGMLRHSDIRTTLNLYTQDDQDEKQAAQGAFLSAVGLGSRFVQ